MIFKRNEIMWNIMLSDDLSESFGLIRSVNLNTTKLINHCFLSNDIFIVISFFSLKGKSVSSFFHKFEISFLDFHEI